MGLHVEAPEAILGIGGEDAQKAFNFPYEININIYRLENNKYTLYHSEKIIGNKRKNIFGIHGLEKNNPGHKSLIGYIYSTSLPAGKYKIYIQDKSSPHPAYQERNIGLGFFVNTRLQ